MSYAMTLDNSWDVMSEDEMYDVNGGWGWSWKWSASTFADNVISLAVSTGIVKLVTYAFTNMGFNMAKWSLKGAIKLLVSGWKAVTGFFTKLTLAGAVQLVAGLAAVGYVLGCAEVF